MSVETTEQHERLIQAMMDPEGWPEGGGHRRRIDTHISTVVLAGDKAYKIKKPLDLGFLDFLSMRSREQACREELRLNRRLAPELYESVCRITGTLDRPSLDDRGELLDWAVQMRRFDPDAILSNHPEVLDEALIDALAERVGRFHDEVDRIPPDDGLGGAAGACAPMWQNFVQIAEYYPPSKGRLDAISAWTTGFCDQQAKRLDERHAAGFTRECHGDLHLGNVALIDSQPVVFDAIEFNPALRWIDPINDLAFLTMDLRHRGHDGLAGRFINRYLQATGDYDGLALLQGFEVYRALVRAKIAAIRLGQPDLGDSERRMIETEFDDYLALAGQLTAPARGAVVILHGVSGSGKSYVAQQLVAQMPAVIVRSDIERKRLLGLEATADATGHDAYSDDVTAQTYQRLHEAVAMAAQAGYLAVADATFLRRGDRRAFRSLATSLGVSFAIIDCDAPVDVLEARIARRAQQSANVSDADQTVLHRQLASREQLDESERDRVVRNAPGRPLDVDRLRDLLTR